MSNTSSSSNQPITLPQSGGAVRGIGETFQANAFSGTGNFTIPIPSSPGRAGFEPQLSLQYSTGNGNSLFGLGWQLSIPRVTRKTEKGLPRYDDDDVFVMSGAEDLVPVLQEVQDPENVSNTNWVKLELIERNGYQIIRYRPRTEGLFARIEKWAKGDDTHWRAIAKDNVTSIYGLSQQACIVNPENPTQIYEWLLEETFDAKGNHIFYEYAQEGPDLQISGIDEQHRSYQSQRYIRRILYGNIPAGLDTGLLVGPERTRPEPVNPENSVTRHYCFEVLFDYGDLEDLNPQPNQLSLEDWQSSYMQSSSNTLTTFAAPDSIRADRFSSYRSGFEIRTLRRCERVLMIHHFQELGGARLVKSMDFGYQPNLDTQISFLENVTVRGYRWDETGKLFISDMPSIALKYSKFEPQTQRYASIAATGNDLPPLSLGDSNVALVDLDGNGLPDMLHTLPTGFRYWRNLGSGKLDRPRTMTQVPAGITLSQPGVSFADMGGDGRADLLVLSGPSRGFYETTPEATWESFKHIHDLPSFDLSDPAIRLVDLTGDGLSDVLMAREQYFVWFQCLGEVGYGDPQFVPKSPEQTGLYFNDPAGRLRLADMTGDGLNDIVLVHNGRIDYWPNLGYGQFGSRITMANAPQLEQNFDPARLFLVDLDGTGCADLVYVDFNQVHFWFNQCGNGWSPQRTIQGTPITTNAATVQFADFYGLGTSTLVWSYDYGQFPGSNYKVLDLCGGIKPHLLVEMDNNLGATTRVQYGSSSRHYLDDEAKGEPWATKLPFPVQVVDKVETIDHISQTKLVTTYSYHHGYFDGREREFRGFGRVDQLDTEEFETFRAPGLHGEADFTNKTEAYHVLPVLTKTWFYTGAYLTEKALMDRYQGEYGKQVGGKVLPQLDPAAFDLGDHAFEWLDSASDISFEQYHEAHRSLRGSVLRQEVYSLDKVEKAFLPYTVTESRYRVRALQPPQEEAHGVYFTTPSQSMAYHYERNLADPRITHEMTLEVDAFGNVLKSATIAYPRRNPATGEHPGEQRKTLVTYTENRVTNKVNEQHWYRVGVPIETQIFELTGIAPAEGEPFQIADFYRIENESAVGYGTTPILNYEASPNETIPQRRRVEWVKTFYRQDAEAANLDAIRLPLGEVESLALPCESLKLAFTAGLLDQIYGDRLPQTERTTLLQDKGKYVEAEGHWWVPSGKQKFDTQLFYLPTASQDPFGNESNLKYDPYGLAVVATQDALGNVTKAAIDYRVLQPYLMRDPNWNYSEVAFDALGLVVATAIMGQAGSNENDDLQGLSTDMDVPALRAQSQADSLAGLQPDLPLEHRRAHLTNPLGGTADDNSQVTPQNIIGDATTRLVYDLHRYRDLQEPVVVYTLARENHAVETTRPQKIQHQLLYSDGFGREAQTKIQAESGPVPMRDDAGRIQVGSDGTVQLTDDNVEPRWVGTGWTIYNNKGKPVQQFEPFFTDTHRYEADVRIGVSPTLFYDPLERVVCTLHPNHTYEKVVFDPWQQTTWDVNDTVLLNPMTDGDVAGFFDQWPGAESFTPWYQRRSNGALGAPERDAATKTEAHAETPTVTYLDTLGRVFLTFANNGKDSRGDDILYETRVALDIEGNDLSITDPRSIQAFTHWFDIAGRKLSIDSQDTGLKRIFLAVDDQPIQTWDANDHTTEMTYDGLRRPVETRVTSPIRDEQGNITGTRTTLTQVMVYGETLGSNAPATNHRGQVYATLDSAGLALNLRYDFKGNLQQSARRLVNAYKEQPGWQGFDATQPMATALASLDTLLESETFYASSQFDALNRVTQSTAPDHDRVDWVDLSLPTLQQGSVYHLTYNEANLLEQVGVDLRPQPGETAGQRQTFVENINYNARGQRTRIDYGNGVTTTYDYADDTFRLQRLQTHRNSTEPLQDLYYTYDPVGNITQIEDRVFETVFNHRERINPINKYTYNPLYRLIKASGREHEQMGPCHYNKGDQKNTEIFELTQQPVENGQALRNYVETYAYDQSGNITQITHRARGDRSWIRNQTYSADSNHLSTSDARCTGENNFTYPHDANGNITRMPHLQALQWDYANRLVATTNNGNGGASVTAFYVYDAGGQRIRKVVEKGGEKIEERIYLGGFEIHRSYDSDGNVTLERQSLHVMDDQKRIALVETRTQGRGDGDESRIRYQLDNHLGSSLLEVNEDAEVISYEEYYPYGGTAYLTGKNVAEVKRKRYRYSGKERDDETGLYYYGARYYAPWLGRWMSCDPIGSADSVNLYQFLKENPLRFKDYHGFQSQETQSQEAQTNQSEGTNAILNYLQRIVNQIPQDQWQPGDVDPDNPSKTMTKGKIGERAHIDLEMELTTGKTANSKVEIQRIIPELIVNEKGIIDSWGKAPATAQDGWRTIDVGILKEGFIREDIIGKKASDVLEVTLDYKTFKAKMRRVKHMEKLIGVPYVKLKKGGNLSLDVSKALSRPSGKLLKSTLPKVLGKAGDVLGVLQDTPAATGNDSLDVFDPHYFERLDDETEYFSRVLRGLPVENSPWTPMDKPNAIADLFTAARQIDKKYEIGKTAITWWGDKAADLVYGE
ncbi:MAG: VCBS repeat-containing protein [Leptolyngbya sp. SIO1E4]|nr:VCBS repeat-containing protein [Leptolyngbya sp. SIO1E4]